MIRLSRAALFESDLSHIISDFFISFNVGALLKKAVLDMLHSYVDTFLNVAAERYFLAEYEIESLFEALMDALLELFKRIFRVVRGQRLFLPTRYSIFKVLLHISCEV